MEESMKIVQSGKSTGWEIEIAEDGDGNASNFNLFRPDGKFFHQTMVKSSVRLKDGTVTEFWQPMCMEHPGEKLDRVGDIVIVLRLHPITGRFMVKCEEEVVFVTEDETSTCIRATRSSVDNVEQSIRKRVTPTGNLYLNSRRAGGQPVKSHVGISNWTPQEANSMVDIYEYVQSPDGPGLAALMKSFQVLPIELAREVLGQVITPPTA